MWIFEILYKIIVDFIQKRTKKEQMQFEEEECDHIFLPIDSTKKILACSKCGMLIKSENLKPKIQKTVFDNPNF